MECWSNEKSSNPNGLCSYVGVRVFGQAGPAAIAQSIKEKAEAEGKLMFYATFNATDSKTLIDGFKQLYPKIDAVFYRSSDSAMMERIMTENRAGQNLWDVVVTTSFYGHNLKKRGLLAAYDSPERKFYRDGYKDPQALWTSTYTNYAAFGYNTRGVPKSSVPKSFNDLLKPEWKGQIGMESRPYEWFGTMLKAMGEEKGLPYMRELAKQTQLRAGRTLLAQLVAAGEFKGALTAYSQTFEVLKPSGAPVDWVYLNPFSPTFIRPASRRKRRIQTPRACSSILCFPNAAKN